MSRDTLSDLLRSVRLRGAVFFYVSLRDRWSAEASTAQEIAEAVMPGCEHAMEYHTPQKAFLRSRANSIEGGTTEVMLNILGERVLGLPGDVRVDREVPWSQVPRN